jgi:hypothetical protein
MNPIYLSNALRTPFACGRYGLVNLCIISSEAGSAIFERV